MPADAHYSSSQKPCGQVRLSCPPVPALSVACQQQCVSSACVLVPVCARARVRVFACMHARVRVRAVRARGGGGERGRDVMPLTA